MCVALSRVNDLHAMVFAEPMSLETLANFKPKQNLLQIDKELKNRSFREFHWQSDSIK
jgi:hypothetical protein